MYGGVVGVERPTEHRGAWRSRSRWAVHLGLLCSAAAALGTLQLLHVRIAYHTDVGLVFVGLAAWVAAGPYQWSGPGAASGAAPILHVLPEPTFPPFTPPRYSAAPSSPLPTIEPCPNYVPPGGWLYSPPPPALIPITLPNGEHICTEPGGVPPDPKTGPVIASPPN